MTKMLILAMFILGGIGLFSFARRRVDQFKRNFFNIAASDLDKAYRQSLKEKKRFNLDVADTRRNFESRADLILDHFCNQVYGGIENTPLDEYEALKAIKKNSVKNCRR